MSLTKRLIATDAAGGADGSANFTPKLYSGGSAGQVVDVGFQPDLIIGKRLDSAEHWWVNDVARSGKSLFLNLDNTEISFQYTTPNSDGFVVNATGGVHNAGNLVAYCFKGGGSAVTNGNGTVASTVSANQAAGFSIVKFSNNNSTTNTFGHGLGGQPELVFIKGLNVQSDWFTYVDLLGKTKRLKWNTTDIQSSWNTNDGTNTPTGINSTTLSFAYSSTSYNFIAYCFRSIVGYQKIGTYEGNANATGPIVTTGFRPRFLMIKNVDSEESGGAAWLVYDSLRSTSNPRDKRIYPNVNSIELQNDNYDLDFNDDGFQIKSYSLNYGYNNANQTYLYLAIA